MDPDISTDGGWLTLAGVGLGYAVATGLVFVLVFAVPFLIFDAM